MPRVLNPKNWRRLDQVRGPPLQNQKKCQLKSNPLHIQLVRDVLGIEPDEYDIFVIFYGDELGVALP